MKLKKQSTDFELYLQEKLKDPEFKKYYDEYDKQFEIAYQILQLRKKKDVAGCFG